MPSAKRRVAVVALPLTALLLVGGCGSGESTDAEEPGGAQTTQVDGASALTFDVDAFADRVDDEGVVVLDVRTPAEFAEGHLPEAVNIDVSAGDFLDRVAELDEDAPIAIYCRSGNRSAAAMQQMSEIGFTDLAHLEGGMAAWQAAGGEVVTD